MVFIKKIKKQSGFTLVEVLTSAFIIALISGLILANYHTTNKRSELIITAQKLASDIRLAQSYALGSRVFSGVSIPPGGWGVYFNLSSPANYIIFGDMNSPNQIYDVGEEFKTVALPSSVTIDSLMAFDSSYQPVNSLNIVFMPPDPTTFINSSYKKGKIILKENTGDTVKTIEVNFLGLVDVID